ncbi:hypothetical protein BDY21DRAFT_372414 [Lineolata rhizophorae]|uniref:Uncharacterized protein n=1 Tax=Lineolata rhizophorae TaxID=578093 RepID=A0A6A6P0J2_9PEZI|nr:hypothetical protein BDY21DRAFT_372414 [Lineolata rhizophorae]
MPIAHEYIGQIRAQLPAQGYAPVGQVPAMNLQPGLGHPDHEFNEFGAPMPQPFLPQQQQVVSSATNVEAQPPDPAYTQPPQHQDDFIPPRQQPRLCSPFLFEERQPWPAQRNLAPEVPQRASTTLPPHQALSRPPETTQYIPTRPMDPSLLVSDHPPVTPVHQQLLHPDRVVPLIAGRTIATTSRAPIDPQLQQTGNPMERYRFGFPPVNSEFDNTDSLSGI